MTEKEKIAVPKKAMTLIVVRERAPSGFEIFLLKRHEQSIFMGGNFVYPGGKIDKEDASDEMVSRSKGVSPEEARRVLRQSGQDNEGIAYWIAGIRESFEEAGILFAYRPDGQLLSTESEDARKRFSLHRQSLQRREKTLLQIMQEEDLFLALDECHYFAHWITPEARNVRFDTRFFIARSVPGQVASHDAKETTEGAWLSPTEALEANIRGTAALSPPTLKTLEDLSRYQSIADLLAALPAIEKPMILPILLNPLADEVLIFPWDPEYEGFKNGELSNITDHGAPAGPMDNTTRLILRDGRWLPYVRLAD
jgi:8-oxo-dGTP pyrophosphatase MutT (NUDIX family)